MEKVNHPKHYNVGNIEVIEYLKDQGLAEDFCIGNVIKYVSRHRHKSNPLEDLKKAMWYLEYLIKITNEKGSGK
jgi:collagenase-like PrtC family protease